MNLYEKLTNIKEEISQAKLKKSGLNKFSGFSYYELSDFLPTIITLCKKYKVCTYTSYTPELATLTAVNAEKADEQLTISSPMKEIELKGCNAIQALGGIETYSRRYLYLAMFDIVENDSFDSVAGKEQPKQPKQATTSMITPAQLAVLKGLNIKTRTPLEQLTYIQAKTIIEKYGKFQKTPEEKAKEAQELKNQPKEVIKGGAK